jgi:hypothetical protein
LEAGSGVVGGKPLTGSSPRCKNLRRTDGM